MFSPRILVPPWRRGLHFTSLGQTSAIPAIRTKDALENQSVIAPEVSVFFSQEYDSLIQSFRSSSHSNDQVKQLHGGFIKKGVVSELFLVNTLITGYFRTQDLVSAYNLFDEMPIKNTVTWSCMISGYTHNGLPEGALGVFREMISSGCSPNHYAFGSALRACQILGPQAFTQGLQIHGLVSKTPYGFDVVLCNVLLSMYGSCILGHGGSECAWRVFEGMENKNSISWNCMITIYSQRADTSSAFRLFSDMQMESCGSSYHPTEYTFGSLITAATESLRCDRAYLLPEQLLARIEKSGFMQDLYVGSALVSCFARYGGVDTAKKIFRGMGTRNSVSLNGLITGLVKLKRGEEAVEIFLESRDMIRLNSDSYVLLLTSFGEFLCSDLGKQKGREVHGFLLRTGMIDLSVPVGNSLINMYAKCGEVEDAYSVFKSMFNRDSVSWSSMISGLDQNDQFLCLMKRSGVVPSNFTLISALSSCSSLGWKYMGEQIQCEGVKLGLNHDVSVTNALLSLYADTGCISECKKVFNHMQEYDQVSWNSIIRAYADSDTSVPIAMMYFMEMLRSGWNPNSVTFINALAAATSLSDVHLAHQIHTLVLKWNLTDDNAVKNSLLTCYGKCREIDDCEIIFTRMTERDEISWNSMISGYIHAERLSDAMELVCLLLNNGHKLDCFTFATVLSACASVATLEHGMEVHACAIRACLVSDVFIGSALVDMYGKCGRIEYASKFFDSMPVRNIYSWNSMISGYARHGDELKALETFTQMKQENQLPDHVTFVGVLSACSHMGLLKEAFEHFESMSKCYGLTPQMEHFSCMVDLLGRAREFEKLEDFINRMPMSPNVLIWRTVIAACGRENGRLLDLGRRAAEKIMELEPENAVNYVLVANMYASEEQWENMAEARHGMKVAAATKEAGRSWVSMKDRVHVFVSGDKSHPFLDEIYKKLRELHREMKARGYVPEIRHAMHDLEAENKEEILSCHSERLAVAFVLTQRKSEMPIRIMKNLRVCVDCHTAFKYISDIVGRQIVLRDSNRFHHFTNGKCSCKDYW